jgi:creatinine amidohydrolase
MAAAADVEPAGSGYVNPRKVLLYESTRKEFREAIESGTLKTVIVPTGSTEQHNEHLAMINDTASVTLVAQKAALMLYPNVMVATPVSVGISPHWMDRKGTLTLKKETFLAVVFVSAAPAGARRENILVLNGHGGNVDPRGKACQIRTQAGDRIETNSYWDATRRNRQEVHTSGRLGPRCGIRDLVRHGWEGVDYDKIKPHLHIKDQSRLCRKKNSRAGKLATTAKGEAMIDIAVSDVRASRQMMA